GRTLYRAGPGAGGGKAVEIQLQLWRTLIDCQQSIARLSIFRRVEGRSHFVQPAAMIELQVHSVGNAVAVLETLARRKPVNLILMIGRPVDFRIQGGKGARDLLDRHSEL